MDTQEVLIIGGLMAASFVAGYGVAVLVRHSADVKNAKIVSYTEDMISHDEFQD